jgi:hypothetical protein
MIRRFWIAFNAVAVAALSLLTIAVDWLIMSAFFVPQRSWQEWREWIWLPVMILPPLWLPWIAWRLLRREIARSRVQNEVMAKSSLSSRPPFVSRDWVNTRKIPGLDPIHRFVSWFWHIGGLNDVKRPLLLTPFGAWFLMFLSSPLLVSALVIFIRSEVFLYRSISVRGTVIQLAEERNEPGDYAPVFAYVARDGRSYTTQSHTYSAQHEFRVGQTVPVLYDKDHPEQARIASHKQVHSLEEFFGALGLFFAGIGFGSLIYQRRQSHRSTGLAIAH